MGLKIVALCKMTVSASVWDNPKECPWATLYSMSPLHLVPVGVAPGLHVHMVDTRRYNKLINDTLILFDLLNSDGVTTVPKHVNLIEKYSFILSRLKKYHDVLSYEARTAASKSKPIDAIPCVLHMHKRMLEKLVSMLFKEALHEAGPSKKAIRFRKAQDIAKQVNTIAFISVEKPGRYKAPFDKVKGVLLEISFNDEWAQKIDVEFAKLIRIIFTTAKARQEIWLDVASNLSKILDTLKKRQEFTDDEIDMLENGIHSISKVWIRMFGREGMMNYFHLLTNGHAIYFLRKWMNLYQYSNQGWEYQKRQIRSRYYHHTNHGGSNGTNGGRGSKIKPIGLWCLRIMH
jgi:hypothetical protein